MSIISLARVFETAMNAFRNAAILALAALGLTACAGEPTSRLPYAPIAPTAENHFQITTDQAGPVTGAIPFSKSGLQKLFPGKDIETIRLATDAKTFYGFVVFEDGLQVMAAEPDAGNRTIVAIHGLGPAVAGPNGETIGMPFSAAGISRRSCKVGKNLWAGMAICTARGASNISLVFFDGSWGAPTGSLPPSDKLAIGQLQRIVWTPPR